MARTDPSKIPFSQLTKALLDTSNPFHPRYLYRLSDLSAADLAELKRIWLEVPLWRRQALMEDLNDLGEADTLLSFEDVARFALKDADAGVRRLAVNVLDSYEVRDLRPIFIDMLANDPDAGVRAASATALGTFIYLGEIEELAVNKLRPVEEILLKTANGNDETLVRRRALEALGFSSREEVPPLIEAAYRSSDDDWLVTAAFAMGRSSNESWSPQVMDLLGHESAEVRCEAAQAAGELRIKEALPRLNEMIDEQDDDIREAAIWALSEIGGTEVQNRLETLLEQAEDDDEIEFLENALENLSFTEDFELFSILDIEEGDEVDEDGLIFDLDEDDDDEFDDEEAA